MPTLPPDSASWLLYPGWIYESIAGFMGGALSVVQLFLRQHFSACLWYDKLNTANSAAWLCHHLCVTLLPVQLDVPHTLPNNYRVYMTAYVETTSEVNMPTAEYILWTDIQDIVGPVTYWPDNIRLFFWTRHLSHWEHIWMAAFVWVNGLNPEVYYDWCDLKRFFNCGSPTHRHYQQLFAYFRQGRRCAHGTS